MFGRAQRCHDCGTDHAQRCGLNEQELSITANDIHGNTHTERALRYLIGYVADNPTGWLTLWGNYGTAKTMTVQAIIASLVHQGKSARFYRASEIEQGWFDDLHAGRSNAELYRRLPILAVDELNKVNLRNDWIRERFQDLLDHRYRHAVAKKQLTLITLQYEPDSCLPGDIASRLKDGRFYRPWMGGANNLVIERWGERVLPGCLHIQGEDARPQIPPDFVVAKKRRGGQHE